MVWPRRFRRGTWAIAAGYIALLHAVVVVLVLKTNFLLLAGKTLGVLPPEEWSPEIAWAAVYQAAQDANVPPGAVVLVGDSIMAQLAPRFAGDAGVADFGIGGDTTHTLMRRLPMIRAIRHASTVVLGVGVNDLKYRPVEQIALDYGRLLALIPPMPVIAVSVLPVDDRAGITSRRPYLENGTIDRLNHLLRSACDARAGCRFLDTWPTMSDPARGGLRPELHGGDGWHLSPKGTEALADLIRSALPPR